MRIVLLIICTLVAVAVPAPAAEPMSTTSPAPADAKGVAYFEEHIRPLLAQHCLECHSAAAGKTRGELALDSRAGWLKGGDSGPAIVPGDPGKSLLITAVHYDHEPKMPPKGKLADRDIVRLVEWVKMGAPDPRTGPVTPTKRIIDIAAGKQHWAFGPLKSVEPPAVKDTTWVATPVDRFILSALEARGLAPNPRADKRRLLRRATLGLIGLPPTPEELAAFESDTRPDAYERLVDGLLARPQFGERWARHWLDVARFAESHGYEQDYDRPNAYHYRDFVTRAFNADLPYDTFVKWQIAGDEFAPDNPQAMMATGFLAAGTHATQITAKEAEKERYDELDDMVRTIGTTMLGLTIGCARCHDHKYDPIPVHDYYRLAATFATTVRSDYDVVLNAAQHKAAWDDWDRQRRQRAEAKARFETETLPGRFAEWRKSRQPPPADTGWILLEPTAQKSAGGATLRLLDDGSVTVTGKNPDRETLTLTVPAGSHLRGVRAIRLEALSDSALVKGGPGRAPNGNFALSDFRVSVLPPVKATTSNKPVAMPVKLATARASFSQPGLEVAKAIDGDKTTAWAVDPQFGRDHAAEFTLESPLDFADAATLSVTLEFANNRQHGLGRFRLSATTATEPLPLEGQPLPADVAAVLARLTADPAAELSPGETAAALRWFRGNDPDWNRLDAELRQHASTEPKPATVKALISSEGVPAVRLHTQGLDFYDPVFHLRRGDPNQKAERADAGFLQVLMSGPEAESRWRVAPPSGARTSWRRRALAEWLTDTEHGAGWLLARVIVNRLWYHHLGRGIVATPSDFGTQGERPTHPELLDFLAGELIRNGWRLKHIHKLIVTSAVYTQGSQVDEARAVADRENSLFWRRPVRRLEAEAVRDSMLAVSGLLDPTLFGPGTLDENHRRRSLYFFVKRSRLIPMMSIFDAPDSLQDIAVRPTTTVAPQALLLLNNRVVRGYAVGLARRANPDGRAMPEAAVDRAYRLALTRSPTADELADAREFLSRQTAAYTADGKPDPAGLALADFCHSLLLLNEFVFID